MKREHVTSSEDFLDLERIRLNLILSSLYLSSFEILKAAIIDSVSLAFVIPPEPNEDFILSLKGQLSDEEYQEAYEANIGWYKNRIKEYNQEVDTVYEKRDRFGLVPSCIWLQKAGVLTQQDVDMVKELREYRNNIAHELPGLVVGTKYVVDVDYLEHASNILRKVGVFLARIDVDVPGEVADEDIVSGRELIFGLIRDAVVEYLKK